MCNRMISAAFLLMCALAPLHAQNLELNLKKAGAPIQPTMYGIFYEDVNTAADGGLYAELIKNRSFEYPQPLQGWTSFGNVTVLSDGPFERNPHYVRLGYPGHPHRLTGLDNEGFFGIPVKAGEKYVFSVWARTAEGTDPGRISINMVDPASDNGTQVFCKAEIVIDSPEWKKYEVEMAPQVTDPESTLRIFLLTPKVSVDLEHVSLFPADTWQGRKGGLRKDLAQALYDLHPGIFRFPGGCIVEGTDLETRYNWKNSVGPVENRPLNQNRWEYTFPHRFYPDYFQSYGLGFYELFQLSEDIGAEPLPVLSCGLACQFQNDSPDAHVPVSELQPYIQDALDLIEFANGDASGEWGSLRAKMGHPEPFGLKFIAIGNEQWGPEYPERLAPFIDAIRAKYPEIRIVGSSGPDSEGEKFNYLWPEMRRLKADLVDEHFYRPYEWFLSQGARYDSYDRQGPEVFAGEYACHAQGYGRNHYLAALVEAAFMTGLERNADVVHMATYAPLFAHVKGWQWRPDLIWYDNMSSVRTCSYHVQQLYSLYKGKNVAQLTCGGVPLCGAEGQDGLFASAVTDGDLIYVKVANTSEAERSLTLDVTGLKKKQVISTVKSVRFSSEDMHAENSLENPDLVKPQELPFSQPAGLQFTLTVEPRTFRIFVFSR